MTALLAGSTPFITIGPKAEIPINKVMDGKATLFTKVSFVAVLTLHLSLSLSLGLPLDFAQLSYLQRALGHIKMQ